MKYTCGVQSGCTASVVKLSNRLQGQNIRAHGTRDEAFRCAQAELRRLDYKRLSSRAWEPPDGGPIRILTKPIRFGYAFRKGKEGRFMPRRGGFVGSY